MAKGKQFYTWGEDGSIDYVYLRNAGNEREAATAHARDRRVSHGKPIRVIPAESVKTFQSIWDVR